MKQITWMLAILLFVTACGPAPEPAPTPDVQATIDTLSSAMVSSTLTAQPTSTTPPTATEPPTATVTATTATIDPSLPTLTATLDPLATLEPSATPWSGAFAPGNTDGLPTGFLLIENNTGVKEITITLNGVTITREQPVYYSYALTRSILITVLWARYNYIIQIPNKKMWTGTFTQNNKDKTTIRVYLNKSPVIVGP